MKHAMPGNVASLSRGPTFGQIGQRSQIGLSARFSAWQRDRRERREIAALGPAGRVELHRLLVARRGAGLSERVWPEAQRTQDLLACGSSPQTRAMASAYLAAILRSSPC